MDADLREVHRSQSKERERKTEDELHYKMTLNLSNKLSQDAKPYWGMFINMMRPYLDNAAILACENIMEICERLLINGVIQFGKYDILSEAFKSIKHQPCEKIVEKYSKKIKAIREQKHSTPCQRQQDIHQDGVEQPKEKDAHRQISNDDTTSLKVTKFPETEKPNEDTLVFSDVVENKQYIRRKQVPKGSFVQEKMHIFEKKEENTHTNDLEKKGELQQVTTALSDLPTDVTTVSHDVQRVIDATMADNVREIRDEVHQISRHVHQFSAELHQFGTELLRRQDLGDILAEHRKELGIGELQQVTTALSDLPTDVKTVSNDVQQVIDTTMRDNVQEIRDEVYQVKRQVHQFSAELHQFRTEMLRRQDLEDILAQYRKVLGIERTEKEVLKTKILETRTPAVNIAEIGLSNSDYQGVSAHKELILADIEKEKERTEKEMIKSKIPGTWTPEVNMEEFELSSSDYQGVSAHKELILADTEKEKDTTEIHGYKLDGTIIEHFTDICREGDLQQFENFIATYNSIEKLKQPDGCNVLHITAKFGNKDRFELLIARICESEQEQYLVACVDNSGKSVLIYALLNSNIEMVDHIVTHYPKLFNCKDNQGNHPLHYAASNGFTCWKILVTFVCSRKETIENLEKCFFCQNALGNTVLMHALNDSQEEIVDDILSMIPNLLRIRNKCGQHPIHIAALNGNVKRVKQIIDNNSDKRSTESRTNFVQNCLDKHHKTILEYAVKSQNAKMVDFCAKHYSSLFHNKIAGRMHVIHYTAACGNVYSLEKVAKVLVTKKVLKTKYDIMYSLVDKNGGTVLMYAIGSSNIQMVAHILNHYPETINVKDKRNQTALDLAKCLHSEPCISMIQKMHSQDNNTQTSKKN